MKPFVRLLFGLSLPLLLLGCQDHRIVANAKLYRLTGYSQLGTRGNFNGTVFTYDANNKLISYTYSLLNTPRSTTTYQYDAQGRLLSNQGPGYYLAFDYDANGNIGSVKQYSSPPTSTTTVPSSISTLWYSASQFPDQITTMAGSSTTITSFTYTNGNVTQKSTSTLMPGTAPTITSMSFQYDSHPNPFYGLVLPIVPFGNNISFTTVDTYSRNNAINAAGLSNYEGYPTYSSNGLLAERYTQAGPTNLISLREIFSYETY